MSSLFMIPHKVSIVIFVPTPPLENKIRQQQWRGNMYNNNNNKSIISVSFKSDHPGFSTFKIQVFKNQVYLTVLGYLF